MRVNAQTGFENVQGLLQATGAGIGTGQQGQGLAVFLGIVEAVAIIERGVEHGNGRAVDVGHAKQFANKLIGREQVVGENEAAAGVAKIFRHAGLTYGEFGQGTDGDVEIARAIGKCHGAQAAIEAAVGAAGLVEIVGTSVVGIADHDQDRPDIARREFGLELAGRGVEAAGADEVAVLIKDLGDGIGEECAGDAGDGQGLGARTFIVIAAAAF